MNAYLYTNFDVKSDLKKAILVWGASTYVLLANEETLMVSEYSTKVLLSYMQHRDFVLEI